MYRPEIKRKRSGAPVLSRKEIDVIGQNIVGDFMPEALKSPQEIDIDLLAQDYLGMDQDFQYLSHCGVYLGMTVFNDTDKVPVYDPQNNWKKIRNIDTVLQWDMRQGMSFYIRNILPMILIR